MLKKIFPFAPLMRWAWLYLELSKWHVTSLMLLTTWVGMELGASTPLSFTSSFFTLLGIGLIASSAASLNHLLDRRLDRLMTRTERRPLPQGKISQTHVFFFSITIGLLGSLFLSYFTNRVTILLSLLSLFGYAIIYTLFLKRLTTQNIVIGGLAGASPPLLGWTASTGHIEPGGLLLGSRYTHEKFWPSCPQN